MKTMKTIIYILIFLILLAVFLYWSNKSIVLTDYTYKTAKVKGDLEELRITQVSDLQSTYFGKNQKNLIEKVKAAKPDMIVFTGDLLDRNHTDYKAATTAISGLVKIAPVYYVNGNHELAFSNEEMSKFYKQLEDIGVILCFDEIKSFRTEWGQKVNVMGISEETIYGEQFDAENPTRKALEDTTSIRNMVKILSSRVSSSDLNILLAHEPQYINDYANEKIDLIFSGHAHGGQIRLPFTQGLYAPGQGKLPKLTSGMHKRSASTMVISRGLGNSVFPFRIFNRPEVVTVTVGKE